MKSVMKCVALAMVILLTLFAVNGMSEIRKGSVSLNPNIGGYIFQGGQHIDDDLTYGLGLGYSFTENWGVEGNFNYVNTDSNADSSDGEKVEAYLYRLDAVYHFMPENKLVPYLSAGVGAIRINGDIDNKGSDPLLDLGGGIKYFITENLAVRGDVRQIITDDPNYNLIYTVGLTYLFGGEKKAAPAAEPAPQPKAPEPAAPQRLDSDGDGVYDDMDKCPDTPRGVAVDSKGCPLDSDGDGVPDYLDKCPDTPKGVAVDSKGCPLDSDGDGVPDYLDKCPDTPKGVAVDSTGCPPAPAPKVITLEDIHFDFDKATLTEEASGMLKKNIQSMKENPGIKVRIEGHTCAHGQDDYNLRLSERRANAVKEYLMKEGGISSERLTTIAYGETRLAMPETPTPQNKNSAEAKTNRRVHFVVITD
jgi:OOP family OmpA-OmpF porin